MTVTDAATARLAEMLDNAQAPEGVALRLMLAKEEWPGFRPGHQQIGDTAYEHDGRIVLVIDENTSDAIDDHVLDAFGQEQWLSLEPMPQ